VSIKEKGGPAKAKGKRQKEKGKTLNLLLPFAFAPEIGAGDEI